MAGPKAEVRRGSGTEWGLQEERRLDPSGLCPGVDGASIAGVSQRGFRPYIGGSSREPV